MDEVIHAAHQTKDNGEGSVGGEDAGHSPESHVPTLESL